MMKNHSPLFWLLLAMIWATCDLSAVAQYKQTYQPDTTTLKAISLFDATGIIETGIPGQEIAICGSLTGKDSSNAFLQAIYLFQTDLLGEPKQLNIFQDLSPFLFYTPRAYALTYDGQRNFYIALGSNDNQLIMSVAPDGSQRWTRKGNHHDYYGVIMDNDSVVFLGQDESVQGVHDYSLAKLDSNGNPGAQGNMFGTVEFDIPEKLISTPDGYMMAGHTFSLGAFNPMLIKADKSLQMLWSRIYTSPGKDMNCKDLVAATDGSGYVFTGRSSHLNDGTDSIYALKTDNSGNVLWAHLYGIDSVRDADAFGIAADPLGRGYVISGRYRPRQGFDKPFIMMVDPLGDPLWIRDYGNRDTTKQEIFKDVIVDQEGDFLYSVGEYTHLDTNNQLTYSLFVVKAGLATGAIPCDSVMSMGTRPALLVSGGSAHEEPFFANSSYTYFVGFSGQMQSTVNCSVIVSRVPILEGSNNHFSFANPVFGQEIQVDYSVDLGAGTLQLADLQGRILRRFPLVEGIHSERFPIGNLPQGLYLLTAYGEDWRTETKRLLILR